MCSSLNLLLSYLSTQVSDFPVIRLFIHLAIRYYGQCSYLARAFQLFGHYSYLAWAFWSFGHYIYLEEELSAISFIRVFNLGTFK